MTARRSRKRVKAAILRSRIPFKGALARGYLRAHERYRAARAGEESSLSANGLPVPPARLRVLVAGTADVSSFLSTGEAQAGHLRELLAQAQRPLETLDAVLDFGCGCGRIARWLSDAPSTKV